MNNKYPVFIPSKGRWETPLTANAFKKIGQSFKLVIEKQEYSQYSRKFIDDELLVVPHRDKGVTVTRNWIWDYAQQMGVKRYWTFDDNISRFNRVHKNQKYQISTKLFLLAIEDFVDRYENVAVASMEYEMFTPQKQKFPPFRLNKRCFSNQLILTDIPFRYKTFFNEDSELCINVLKNGWCTILFNAFVVQKKRTMTMKGGNTPYYNATNNRLEFVKELQQAHPDVVHIVQRYGRWHHMIDYDRFKNNKLIKKEGIEIKDGWDEYRMVLEERDKK